MDTLIRRNTYTLQRLSHAFNRKRISKELRRLPLGYDGLPVLLCHLWKMPVVWIDVKVHLLCIIYKWRERVYYLEEPWILLCRQGKGKSQFWLRSIGWRSRISISDTMWMEECLRLSTAVFDAKLYKWLEPYQERHQTNTVIAQGRMLLKRRYGDTHKSSMNHFYHFFQFHCKVISVTTSINTKIHPVVVFFIPLSTLLKSFKLHTTDILIEHCWYSTWYRTLLIFNYKL